MCGLVSNLESKEGLDAVGSVKTIQAIGPDGATLSAEKEAFKMSFKITCVSLSLSLSLSLKQTYFHLFFKWQI